MVERNRCFVRQTQHRATLGADAHGVTYAKSVFEFRGLKRGAIEQAPGDDALHGNDTGRGGSGAALGSQNNDGRLKSADADKANDKERVNSARSGQSEKCYSKMRCLDT